MFFHARKKRDENSLSIVNTTEITAVALEDELKATDNLTSAAGGGHDGVDHCECGVIVDDFI